jgi:hypothetical protein
MKIISFGMLPTTIIKRCYLDYKYNADVKYHFSDFQAGAILDYLYESGQITDEQHEHFTKCLDLE